MKKKVVLLSDLIKIIEEKEPFEELPEDLWTAVKIIVQNNDKAKFNQLFVVAPFSIASQHIVEKIQNYVNELTVVEVDEDVEGEV